MQIFDCAQLVDKRIAFISLICAIAVWFTLINAHKSCLKSKLPLCILQSHQSDSYALQLKFVQFYNFKSLWYFLAFYSPDVSYCMDTAPGCPSYVMPSTVTLKRDTLSVLKNVTSALPSESVWMLGSQCTVVRRSR